MHIHPCVHKIMVADKNGVRATYFVAERERNNEETVYWWPKGTKDYESESYLDSPYHFTDLAAANRCAAGLFGETLGRRFLAWLHRTTGKVLGAQGG